MESSRWESFWAEESGGAEAGEGTGADQISSVFSLTHYASPFA